VPGSTVHFYRIEQELLLTHEEELHLTEDYKVMEILGEAFVVEGRQVEQVYRSCSLPRSSSYILLRTIRWWPTRMLFQKQILFLGEKKTLSQNMHECFFH
jgi:hypothetical protein